MNGNFQLEFPYGTERVTLQFVDYADTLQDKTHIVTFEVGESGVIYEEVIMQRLPEPIIFDSREESVIEIDTGGDEGTLGNITIPANSVYDADGNLYEVA